MKYGNLEVGNITQNLLSTTRPCSSIEFRNFFSTLQAKHFEICQLLHSSIYQVMQYFWVFILNSFSLLWNFFFSKENCVSFVLFVSSLSLSQSAQILPGKPTVWVFC